MPKKINLPKTATEFQTHSAVRLRGLQMKCTSAKIQPPPHKILEPIKLQTWIRKPANMQHEKAIKQGRLRI
ncbi:MAG: hypothetical protein ACLP5V_07615 [Candidatus Bathyarchaeia archaeon]